MNKANKKFILIGGSNRSGTTLLNLILANDPKAMALGEVINIFEPKYPHHREKIASLIKEDPVWAQIISEGVDKLYSNLIKSFPDIDYFIDSSKTPEWYKNQIEQNPDLDIKNLLIFKHPLDQKKSHLKRSANAKWKLITLNYYRRYLFTIDNFRSVSLSAFLKDITVLEKLCSHLSMPFSADKMEYWNREHPNFFGSPTVKKKTIDSSNVRDFESLSDIEDIEGELNSSLINMYSFMLGKAIWLENIETGKYQISLIKKLYLNFRNKVSMPFSILRESLFSRN